MHNMNAVLSREAVQAGVRWLSLRRLLTSLGPASPSLRVWYAGTSSARLSHEDGAGRTGPYPGRMIHIAAPVQPFLPPSPDPVRAAMEGGLQQPFPSGPLAPLRSGSHWLCRAWIHTSIHSCCCTGRSPHCRTHMQVPDLLHALPLSAHQLQRSVVASGEKQQKAEYRISKR